MSDSSDYVLDCFQHLKVGYATLLYAPSDAFSKPGVAYVATPRRDLPEWSNWVLPIWVVAIGSAVVCSVSPQYMERVEDRLGLASARSLMTAELLLRAHTVINAAGWRQREIFAYLRGRRPEPTSSYQVEALADVADGGERILRSFDGGAFVIRNEVGEIISYVGIKEKGIIQEIAVGTELGYQRRGMAKAVVAHAVGEILDRGKVPVYVPDVETNLPSYALARSLNFVKVGEMLFWEYELPSV